MPLGYRKTRNHHLRIRPAEAAVVRQVFETYCRAGSDGETAHQLNAAGVPYRAGRWSAHTVAMLLGNALYTGRFSQSGVTKDLPRLRIVEEELAERVRMARARKLRNGKRAGASLREAAIESVFAQYLESLEGA